MNENTDPMVSETTAVVVDRLGDEVELPLPQWVIDRVGVAMAEQASRVSRMIDRVCVEHPDDPVIADLRDMLARIDAWPRHRRKVSPYGVRAEVLLAAAMKRWKSAAQPAHEAAQDAVRDTGTVTVIDPRSKETGTMIPVNLTPHTITFIISGDDGDTSVDLDPSGDVARVDQKRAQVDTLALSFGDDGDITLPVNRSTFGHITGLPDPVAGTIFIVSMLVAQAAPHRSDLYAVDLTVRDANGRIIGAKGLAVA